MYPAPQKSGGQQAHFIRIMKGRATVFIMFCTFELVEQCIQLTSGFMHSLRSDMFAVCSCSGWTHGPGRPLLWTWYASLHQIVRSTSPMSIRPTFFVPPPDLRCLGLPSYPKPLFAYHDSAIVYYVCHLYAGQALVVHDDLGLSNKEKWPDRATPLSLLAYDRWRLSS